MGAKDSSSPPDYEKLMRQGFELQREFAPKYARQEYQLRQQFDPKLIREQQGLQAKFGPRQYQQQLQALQQLDPLGWYARQKLGKDTLRDLSRGYIDPRQEALYGLMAGQTRGELARGRALSPEMQRETEQALRAGQSARGNIYGNAPLSAEALYKGARGQQLYQQRLQNAQSVYQQQTGSEKARAQAGSFLSLATPEQRISNVQGVQAPRGFGYVNPQAGQQAAAFGLANYPNQAAQGSDNPWATALGIVGGITGAIGGSYVGIGPAAGGQLGSATGSALGGWIGSDARIKRDIVSIGKSPRGFEIVEYSYKTGSTRYRGVIAQQAAQIAPECVGERDGYLTVNYSNTDVEFQKQCSACREFVSVSGFAKRCTGGRLKLQNQCKICKANWRKLNQEKISEWSKSYSLKNKERISEIGRVWRREHRDERRIWERQYLYSNTPRRIAQNLRCRIRAVLKGRTKSDHLYDVIGCSLPDFQIYLESRFEPKMSWDNYGTEWHIDHIIPCALFDLSKPDHVRRCFHFSNLQPMWGVENIRKGARTMRGKEQISLGI